MKIKGPRKWRENEVKLSKMKINVLKPITTTVILIHSTLSIHFYPIVYHISRTFHISEMHHIKAPQYTEGFILVVHSCAYIATWLELSMITVIAKYQNGTTTVITLSTTTIIKWQIKSSCNICTTKTKKWTLLYVVRPWLDASLRYDIFLKYDAQLDRNG